MVVVAVQAGVELDGIAGILIAAPVVALLTLVVRRVITAAFVRRCIPPGCVAPPSHTPGMLGRRALPAGRIDGLGASP
jgi:hypothetical protein